MLIIDLLRHGALEGGVKYRGSIDDPLTSQGREVMNQMWAKVEHDVTTIISSPLSRCAQPAQAWAKSAAIDCLLEPKIQELYYGDWEGKTAAEISQHKPELLKQWRTDPSSMTPPNGESMQVFSQRVQSFLQALIEQYDDEHVLVVAHSGTTRMLIAHALQAPIASTRHLHMPYACWSRLQVKDGHVSLLFHAKEVA
ncbi:MAG: histidine phosphatase family protein [Ghiorsea sp.]